MPRLSLGGGKGLADSLSRCFGDGLHGADRTGDLEDERAEDFCDLFSFKFELGGGGGLTGRKGIGVPRCSRGS